MPYTSTDLEVIIAKLESRLSSGVARITFEGRSTEYSSPSEIQKAILYFRGLLGGVVAGETGTPRNRVTRMYSNRGF